MSIGFSPLDKEVIDLEKARSCAYQANYHLIWATKYRRKVLLGSDHGFQLMTAKVHHGDHIHVFVSARPKLCIPELVRVLKSNSATLLFEEFAEISFLLWVEFVVYVYLFPISVNSIE